MKKIKILVLTDAVWNPNNNVGNSYSNIFGNFNEFEIYNISCQTGVYDTNIVQRCFQMSEKAIINRILHKKVKRDKDVECFNTPKGRSNIEKKIYDYVRISRFSFFYFLRDLIWATKLWKNQELEHFLSSIEPDIIFLQLQGTKHLNDLAVYVKEKLQRPMIAYAWDDIYTLQQFSLSPFFWLDRFIQRKKVRKSVSLCENLYGICERQCQVYEEIFKKPCLLLYKGYVFHEEFLLRKTREKKNKLRILYAGTIGDGRFDTLCEFVKVLKRVKCSECQIQLDIYTMNPVTQRMRNKLEYNNISRFCGKISNEKLEYLIEKADIVLHVEPFALKGSLKVAMSFSTKLVDYFYKGKCIFSVGSKRSSSIQYLIKNNAALVATDIKQMERNLEKILSDYSLVSFYEKQAYTIGQEYHDIKKIQQQLYDNFASVLGE